SSGTARAVGSAGASTPVVTAPHPARTRCTKGTSTCASLPSAVSCRRTASGCFFHSARDTFLPARSSARRAAIGSNSSVSSTSSNSYSRTRLPCPKPALNGSHKTSRAASSLAPYPPREPGSRASEQRGQGFGVEHGVVAVAGVEDGVYGFGFRGQLSHDRHPARKFIFCIKVAEAFVHRRALLRPTLGIATVKTHDGQA